MILKGNQRAGASDLATHLLNIADNEHIELAEVTGAIADDLHGAFAEYEALAVGTQCKKALYSLSINPPEPITREQYGQAIDHIERRLGLTGQPRSIIFHIKQGSGREHCHVVWSRIDTAKMRAVHLSHDHLKLRTLSRELAARFGLELPLGLAEDRDIDRFETADMSLGEKAQAEKSGISPIERQAEITAVYKGSDSPAAFAAALEHRGYYLAIGDRRSHIVVDRHGDIHSLSRQIDGVKARQLRIFLEGLDMSTLEEARKHAASDGQADDLARQELLKSRLVDTFKVLRRKQASRRLLHYGSSALLRKKHASEQTLLRNAQEIERESSRRSRFVSAVLKLLSRVPVLRSVLSHLQKGSHQSLNVRHDLETKALARRHNRERLGLARRKAALLKVEKRERQIMARSLLRGIRGRDHKRDMFGITARDITGLLLRYAGGDESFADTLSQTEQARLNALFENGLSPIFNASASLDLVEGDKEDSSGHLLDGPDDESHETDIALFEFGLAPRFSDRSGVDDPPSADTDTVDNEPAPDRPDPSSRPSS